MAQNYLSWNSEIGTFPNEVDAMPELVIALVCTKAALLTNDTVLCDFNGAIASSLSVLAEYSIIYGKDWGKHISNDQVVLIQSKINPIRSDSREAFSLFSYVCSDEDWFASNVTRKLSNRSQEHPQSFISKLAGVGLFATWVLRPVCSLTFNEEAARLSVQSRLGSLLEADVPLDDFKDCLKVKHDVQTNTTSVSVDVHSMIEIVSLMVKEAEKK